MEHKALAALIIRLAGLWQIVVAANALPQAIAPLFNAEYARTAGYGWLALNAVLTIAVPLAIGLFLVYFPRTVAGSMLRPAIGPEEFAGLVTAGLQLAFGIWLLLGSRGLVNALARLRGR